MNSRQLKVFKIVAEMGNFTKAARQLHIVQPAVSNTIKKLEDELQLSLFIRKDKSVSLTTEGEVLLKNAHIILSQFEKAELEMVELREMERGEVRIGVTDTLGTYYLPKIITAFKQKYPGLNFSIQVHGFRKMQQLIEEGLIDMGTVIMDDMSNNMDGCHFLTDEIVACVAKSHPLAEYSVISHREFVQESLIGFNHGTYKREIMEKICRQEKVIPNFIFETNLISLIKDVVADGYGVTWSSRPVVEGDPRLKMIPFDPPHYIKFAVAWKKGSELSMANRAFVNFLVDFGVKRQKKRHR